MQIGHVVCRRQRTKRQRADAQTLSCDAVGWDMRLASIEAACCRWLLLVQLVNSILRRAPRSALCVDPSHAACHSPGLLQLCSRAVSPARSVLLSSDEFARFADVSQQLCNRLIRLLLTNSLSQHDFTRPRTDRHSAPNPVHDLPLSTRHSTSNRNPARQCSATTVHLLDRVSIVALRSMAIRSSVASHSASTHTPLVDPLRVLLFRTTFLGMARPNLTIRVCTLCTTRLIVVARIVYCAIGVFGRLVNSVILCIGTIL